MSTRVPTSRMPPAHWRRSRPAPPDPNTPPRTWEEEKAELWQQIKQYDEKLASDPHDATSLSFRAEALFRIGEDDRALADAASLIRLLPDDPRPYLERAFMWQLSGQLTKAIDDATTAIRLSPRLARAYERRAEIWELCDSFEKAVVDYSMIVKLAGTHRGQKERALGRRAAAYRRLGSFDKALNSSVQTGGIKWRW